MSSNNARRAYQAYVEFTGGKTFDGRDMPTWENLTERIQQAWTAATDAVDLTKHPVEGAKLYVDEVPSPDGKKQTLLSKYVRIGYILQDGENHEDGEAKLRELTDRLAKLSTEEIRS